MAIVEPCLLLLDSDAAETDQLDDRLLRLSIRGQFGPSPTLFESAAQLSQIKAWLARRHYKVVWVWLMSPYLLAPFIYIPSTHRIARPTHDWREDLTIPVGDRDLAVAIAGQADLLMPGTRQSDWEGARWFPLESDSIASADFTRTVEAIPSPEPVVLYQGPVDYRLDYAGLENLVRANPGSQLTLIGRRGLLSQDSRVELERLLASSSVTYVEDGQSPEAESFRRRASVGILPLALEDLDFSQDLANLADFCRRYNCPGIVTGSERRLSKELNLTFATIADVNLRAFCASGILDTPPPRFLEKVGELLGRRGGSETTQPITQIGSCRLGELSALGSGLKVSQILEAAEVLGAPVFAPEHRELLVRGLRALAHTPRGYAWTTLMARLGEFYYYNGAQRRGLSLMARLERQCRHDIVGARARLDLLSRYRSMCIGCGDAVTAERLERDIAHIRSALNILPEN